MIDIGRVCVKIAGRDAGLKCVVIDVLDKTFVTVDGQTRRRKCNVLHLEPTGDKLDIGKGASRDEVVKAFESLNIDIVERKSRKKGPAPKPVRLKKEPVEAVKKAVAKKLDEKVKVAPEKIKAAPETRKVPQKVSARTEKPIAVAAH